MFSNGTAMGMMVWNGAGGFGLMAFHGLAWILVLTLLVAGLYSLVRLAGAERELGNVHNTDQETRK